MIPVDEPMQMTVTPDGSDPMRQRRPLSKLALFGYALASAAIFAPSLWTLTQYALGTSLHSHVVLVPFISAYLLLLKRTELPNRGRPSFMPAAALLFFAFLAWIAPSHVQSRSLSLNDTLALRTFSFVCCVVAGGFLFAGRSWMRAAASPFAFLLFMIPLPDQVAETFETASKLASAEAAAAFFNLTGTPFLRDGVYFQLPGITIQVAQECSGIRSSWVLLITSLLAAHMFLRNQWNRFVLVAFVIPLGVIRNGFRILVIGLLCIHYGPYMIESAIHRRGGPVFFALSLIPLYGLLWWLRSREIARAKSPTLLGEGVSS